MMGFCDDCDGHYERREEDDARRTIYSDDDGIHDRAIAIWKQTVASLEDRVSDLTLQVDDVHMQIAMLTESRDQEQARAQELFDLVADLDCALIRERGLQGVLAASEEEQSTMKLKLDEHHVTIKYWVNVNESLQKELEEARTNTFSLRRRRTSWRLLCGIGAIMALMTDGLTTPFKIRTIYLLTTRTIHLPRSVLVTE